MSKKINRDSLEKIGFLFIISVFILLTPIDTTQQFRAVASVFGLIMSSIYFGVIGRGKNWFLGYPELKETGRIVRGKKR